MYRDAFEKCPRCALELARGWCKCGGRWVEESMLAELVREMLPLELARVQLAAVRRAEPAIACPTCGDTMEPTEIHDVPIDRCAKHGVWFDRDELQRALYRISQQGIPAPPVVMLPIERPPVVVEPPPRPEVTAPEPDPDWSEDGRMNDRQGLGMGPGDGPWRPGP